MLLKIQTQDLDKREEDGDVDFSKVLTNCSLYPKLFKNLANSFWDGFVLRFSMADIACLLHSSFLANLS
jgi:hypothetical protein